MARSCSFIFNSCSTFVSRSLEFSLQIGTHAQCRVKLARLVQNGRSSFEAGKIVDDCGRSGWQLADNTTKNLRSLALFEV
jgi:hypothetical protein